MPRPSRRPAAVAVVLAALAVPTVASAADVDTIDGLSPRLTAVARSAGSTAATQARRAGVPASGPASLARAGGRVLAEVSVTGDVAARADALRATGARVVHESAGAGVVTVAVAPSALRRVAAVPGVRIAREVLRPALREPQGTARAESAAVCGSVRSAGDVLMHADEAREQQGVDGTGVTVGVLSDTYDLAPDDATDAAADVASGDLPGPANPCGRTTPVDVLDDGAVADDPETVPSDEGRAMVQLVHDLAPGAGLSFATAFTGQQGFADNIRRLRAAGAQIITDDVGYYDEPFFQSGPIETAISDVRRDGASYYSSAGNSHVRDAAGRPIGSWETPALRPTTTGVPATPTAPGPEGVLPQPDATTAFEDFDPASGAVDTGLGITVPAGATLLLDLQWAEPWDGVRTDLDLYLHDGTGAVLAKSAEPNAAPFEQGGQRPVEILSWENTGTAARTVEASIVRSGAGAALAPRAKMLIATQGGGNVTALEHAGTSTDTFGPTIFGHSGGEDTVSVAAVNAGAPQAPATYSSRGPVARLFGPVRTDGRPADALPAPQTLSKPDLAAIDCTRTTFFSGDDAIFCGTSAAAPHAAAVDALARQAAPWATDDQIVAAVRGSGRALPTYGPLDAGSGRIDALAAVTAARAIPRPAAPAPEQPAPAPAPAPTPAVPAAPSVPVLRDTTKPVVRIASGPRPRTRVRRARFVVRTEKGAKLRCRVDRGRWRACRSPFVVKARVGLHVVRIQATDAAGNRSRVAVRRWRVLRAR